MASDTDFAPSVNRTVSLAGRRFTVSPITVGQIRRIRAEFRTIPAPQPVTVDVTGLVEAMFRHGPAEDDAVKLLAGKFGPMELGKIRRDIQYTVQEMVREARARTEQWPPAIESPEGMDLILNHEGIQPVFLQVILCKNHPEIDQEAALGLMEDVAVHEYAELVDAAFRSLNEYTAAKADERMSDPKVQRMIEMQARLNSLTAGGAPVAQALPNGAAR